ncbi:hypothetical protein Lqui_2957 [Legionella quinlivanii]|uniref:Uncharacterized protein n=1 Tax=Legionella quinlivanii TaxID=45073 RepID=A0A0W0XLT2_9GAMM|nr:hypothetical protein [Legionella quinlivanii]KTD45486.1 hypothetical protein Lqui_2957 [Legionella quinlivanii]SEG45875.1 hypothetical protein SAMN02746093_03024 [Legionella quinlivanii DSM 21216]STY11569.1 Uncharacterised protein [Legionella quinlivanii]
MKKKRLLGLALLLCSFSLMAGECKTSRENYFENEDAKAWITTLCPKDILAYHSHQFPRVIVPQEDGSLQVVYRSGERRIIQLTKSMPMFLDTAQGQELHQDINIGKTALHILVIEIRKKS